MRENEKNTLLRDWVPPGHGLLPILSLGDHALGLKKRTGLAPFDPTFGKLLSTLHAQMKFTDAYKKERVLREKGIQQACLVSLRTFRFSYQTELSTLSYRCRYKNRSSFESF